MPLGILHPSPLRLSCCPNLTAPPVATPAIAPAPTAPPTIGAKQIPRQGAACVHRPVRTMPLFDGARCSSAFEALTIFCFMNNRCRLIRGDNRRQRVSHSIRSNSAGQSESHFAVRPGHSTLIYRYHLSFKSRYFLVAPGRYPNTSGYTT